jgi:hypothetical protein
MLVLALWPTIPAEEAEIRRRATTATRQRTIEANGIDCRARLAPGTTTNPARFVRRAPGANAVRWLVSRAHLGRRTLRE